MPFILAKRLKLAILDAWKKGPRTGSATKSSTSTRVRRHWKRMTANLIAVRRVSKRWILKRITTFYDLACRYPHMRAELASNTSVHRHFGRGLREPQPVVPLPRQGYPALLCIPLSTLLCFWLLLYHYFWSFVSTVEAKFVVVISFRTGLAELLSGLLPRVLGAVHCLRGFVCAFTLSLELCNCQAGHIVRFDKLVVF